jgi:hypothetical protein
MMNGASHGRFLKHALLSYRLFSTVTTYKFTAFGYDTMMMVLRYVIE